MVARFVWPLLCAIVLFSSTLASAQVPQEMEEPVQTEEALEEEAPDEVEGLTRAEVILWLFDGDEVVVTPFQRAVSDALAAQPGRHILGERAFRQWIQRQSTPIPSCFLGQATCMSPRALVFESTGISALLRVELVTSGQTRARYELVDRRGQTTRTSELEGETPRDAAFALVRDLFDATGFVAFTTEPDQAEILIDGEVIGYSPLEHRLPVGRYAYRIRKADHTTIEGEIEVVSATTRVVERTLQQEMGTLRITDAPDGARIFIDGRAVGSVDQRLELAPGNYAFEVRADGFETMQDQVEISPGTESVRSIPLQSTNPLLRDISQEAITYNPLKLRLGWEFGFQNSAFAPARGRDESRFEIAGFTDAQGELPQDFILTPYVWTQGARFDVSWTLRNFGITLLSVSWLYGTPELDLQLRDVGGALTPGTLESIHRLQVRPFQVLYRHFHKNFVPFVDAGIGIDFGWLQVRRELEEAATLRQSQALLAFGVGLQYYITPRFFAMGRYSLQGYFEIDTGMDHQFQLGLGFSLPELFGLDARPPETL